MPKEPKHSSHNPDTVEETVEQAVERSYGKKIVNPIKKSAEETKGN